MVIDATSMDRQHNTMIKHCGKRQLALALATIAFLISACTETKSARCRQLYAIAEEIAASNQSLDLSTKHKPIEFQSWRSAATRFERGANRIGALQIELPELVAYQNQFVALYRLYARAIEKAVRARENQDLAAFNLARADAIEAGLVQQQTVREINAYCLSKLSD